MLPFLDSAFTQTDIGFGFICGAIACSALHVMMMTLCQRGNVSDSESDSSSEYESDDLSGEGSPSASCSMSRSMSRSNLTEQEGDLVPPPPLPVYRSEPLSPGMMSASGSASQSRSDSFSQRVQQQQDELNGGMGWSAPENFGGPVY